MKDIKQNPTSLQLFCNNIFKNLNLQKNFMFGK